MAAVDARFVFVEPDPFLGKLKKASGYIPNFYAEAPSLSTSSEQPDAAMWTASRPLEGIVAKPNTHAIVQVINAQGERLAVFNRLGNESDVQYAASGFTSPSASHWTDWLLTSVHEERAEKTQIVETFGDTYLYAFGQRPRVLAFGGLLFNTADYNWRAIFWENWERFFRATKLVEKNARMYIQFDDIVVEGYPLNAAADQTASDNNAIAFNFTFFVTNYVNLSAQNGFETARNLSTTIVEAGWSKWEDAPDLSANYNRLIDLIPGFGNYNKAQLPSSLSAFSGFQKLLPSASDAVATSISIAAGLRSTPNAGVMAANTIAEQLEYWKSVGVTEIEKKYNIQPGDINTWFGYLADILDRQADTNVFNPVSNLNALVNGSNKHGLADAINSTLAGDAAGVGTGLTKATGIAALTMPGGV